MDQRTGLLLASPRAGSCLDRLQLPCHAFLTAFMYRFRKAAAEDSSETNHGLVAASW